MFPAIQSIFSSFLKIVVTEQEKAALGQEFLLKGLAKASLTVLVEMMKNCIAENARIAQDQGKYQISNEPQIYLHVSRLCTANATTAW